MPLQRLVDHAVENMDKGPAAELAQFHGESIGKPQSVLLAVLSRDCKLT